jgi:hypothetical protein
MGENNMPETSEQSAPLELLSDQIQEIFSWHRSQAKCMASMILTMIRFLRKFNRGEFAEIYVFFETENFLMCTEPCGYS